MLKWFILLLAVALMISSCDKCKLHDKYLVNLSADNAVVRISGDEWNSYSSAELRDEVLSKLASSFKEPKQLDYVTGTAPADFYVTIDSVRTHSTSWTETRTDPCYDADEHGWLYNALFPPEEYTYTLHSATLDVYLTLSDSAGNHRISYYESIYDTQSLTQPTLADTSQCAQYEVTGCGYGSCAVETSGKTNYRGIKCKIREWVEGQ